jgi:hypothetical protein
VYGSVALPDQGERAQIPGIRTTFWKIYGIRLNSDIIRSAPSDDERRGEYESGMGP